MGGNIFSTSRVDKATYEKTLAEVLDICAGLGEMKAVPYCGDKDNFGDIDILCNFDAGRMLTFLKVYSTKRFGAPSINDGVVSVGFGLDDDDGIIQVDFICRPNNFQDALDYRSYGDFGHIVGAIFDEQGNDNFSYSLGENGLIAKSGSRKAGQKRVRICGFVEALPLIMIPEAVWTNGFATETEMFHVIMESPYLRPGRFLPRGKPERPALSRFAVELETGGFFSLDTNKPLLIKTDTVTGLFGYAWLEEVENHKKYDDALHLFYDHINGDTIAQVTGLTGKDLGELMKKIATFNEIVKQAAEDGFDPIAAFVAKLMEHVQLPDKNVPVGISRHLPIK